MSLNTNLTNRVPARQSLNTLEVFGDNDLQRLAVANVITVATGTNLTIEIKASGVSSPVSFVLEGSAQLRFTNNSAVSNWSYTGTADFIAGSAQRVSMRNVVIIAMAVSKFASLTGPTLNINDCAIIGFNDLGSITSGSFILKFTSIVNCGSMDLINGFFSGLNNAFFGTPTNGGAAINLFDDVAFQHLVHSNLLIAPSASDALVRIDPGIPDSNRFVMDLNTAQLGTLFLTNDGTTGAFDTVADAAIPATTITSVIDNGVAQFVFTGQTVFVHQEVIISGFSPSTGYNGTFFVTAAGVGFFEVSSIPFNGSEAGSFLSNSITLTETGTSLSDGDTLVLDTTLSVDYDGGATVYNQLTNSFQVNMTFVATEAGTWDTSGIGQKDPRVLSRNNPKFVDSKYIMCGAANGNTLLTDILAADIYQPFTFITTGDGAFTESSTIERFKLIDIATGTFECISNEPIDGSVQFNVTLDRGTGSDFTYKLTISKSTDDGSTYTPFESITAIEVKSGETKATSLIMPFTAEFGDLIRPEIQTTSPTNSDVTATYFSIFGEG